MTPSGLPIQIVYLTDGADVSAAIRDAASAKRNLLVYGYEPDRFMTNTSGEGPFVRLSMTAYEYCAEPVQTETRLLSFGCDFPFQMPEKASRRPRRRSSFGNWQSNPPSPF